MECEPRVILLVEDEESHLELLRRSFQRNGEQVQLLTANSIETARSVLAATTPDLVIIDLQLPDGRGTDLLAAPLPRFPVVLMTSHGNEQVAVEAIKAGALDYVVKSPAVLTDMPRVARRALREWHHITERIRAEEERRQLVDRIKRQNSTVVRLATLPDLEAGHLDRGLATVAEAAARTLEVAMVSIYRIAEHGARLGRLVCHRQGVPGRSPELLSAASLPVFFVSLSRGPVLEVADTLSDPRTAELTTGHWAPNRIGATLCAPVRLGGEMVGLVLHDHAGGRRRWNPDEVTFAGQVAELVARAFLTAELQDSHRSLREAYDTTLEGWARALELRDRETEGHTRRVTELTLRLATAIGMAPGELEHVRRGALLHDIGKMGIPDSLLLKPGRFTLEERRVMQRHPDLARELLAPIAFLRPALAIPYCHHERWDGSGYPRGLSGTQIPIAARIFTVVDVWDALLSDRPYRRAWPRSRVLRHLERSAGSHFDPAVVQCFLEHLAVQEG